MRYIGTQAMGIRLPIISQGDPLADIVAASVYQAVKADNIRLRGDDVVAVTEAIVAKAQGNYASLDQVAEDIRQKFPGGEVGVVFPIMSRNRFFNILKGIARGADKVYVLLSYPSDEMGNPLIDMNRRDEIIDKLPARPVSAAAFKECAGDVRHPFTGVDYLDLYESIGDHVRVYLSDDPRDILKLTPHVLAADVHTRFITRNRLVKAGAETAYTLSDILSSSVNGSGFNADYGLLGSNLATEDNLKLFPRDCDTFIQSLQKKLSTLTGVKPEVMVYGDGAFKDPARGIWELADPVVSPAYTDRLGGLPNEIKIKMVADQVLTGMDSEAKTRAIRKMIRDKTGDNPYREGTTPRKYADLLGSLCDLISGSGDKGTPVVLVQGYFDNYAEE